MAWISVHDHVDGKKLRRLSKALDCSKAEALGLLNFLWFWGLNNADENGRIEDADRDDIAEVFSGKTKLPLDDVVDALFSSGWLDDADGIIYLHDWSDWQEQWYKFCKKRSYDAERKRNERAKNRKPHETELPPESPDHGEHEEVPPVKGDTGSTPPEGAPDGGAKKKRKKPERKTVQMADFVHLTEREYQKLCSNYGEQAAKLMIWELDLYKGANKKTYADDYRAILSWVVDRVKEKHPGVIVTKPAKDGNPFEDYKEGDT